MAGYFARSTGESRLIRADQEKSAPCARRQGTLFADGTPDLVVRPLDTAGVAAALRYAADAGLAVTARSGGHSMAGLSTSADGMIIDTRRISGVRLLDPASGRVRVGADAVEHAGLFWALRGGGAFWRRETRDPVRPAVAAGEAGRRPGHPWIRVVWEMRQPL